MSGSRLDARRKAFHGAAIDVCIFAFAVSNTLSEAGDPGPLLRVIDSPTASGQRQTHSRFAAAIAGSEHGFTLAGVLVICTIVMIFVVYTVPRQWSVIMKREREKQAMFVMKQYARSIK